MPRQSRFHFTRSCEKKKTRERNQSYLHICHGSGSALKNTEISILHIKINVNLYVKYF